MLGICLLFCFNVGDVYAADQSDVWQYEKNIEQVAEPLTEQMMQSIYDENYDSFQSNLSAKMKEVFPESSFKKMVSGLKDTVGIYKTKEVMNIELSTEYMVINYKSTFSKMADPMLIRVVLINENGKTCIGGLWFNPMKLAGHTDPNPFK
jgi:hypothetical protein